jgi:hypothetical protein
VLECGDGMGGGRLSIVVAEQFPVTDIAKVQL